jgi:hypothetical protein
MAIHLHRSYGKKPLQDMDEKSRYCLVNVLTSRN